MLLHTSAYGAVLGDTRQWPYASSRWCQSKLYANKSRRDAESWDGALWSSAA
jgi:hypothetical protein